MVCCITNWIKRVFVGRASSDRGKRESHLKKSIKNVGDLLELLGDIQQEWKDDDKRFFIEAFLIKRM